MSGPANSINQVPLSDVLPSDHVAAADHLLRLVHELDVHPSAVGRIQWHWYPEHNTKPAMPAERSYELVFDTTITLFNQSSDWLELTLDVAWRPWTKKISKARRRDTVPIGCGQLLACRRRGISI